MSCVLYVICYVLCVVCATTCLTERGKGVFCKGFVCQLWMWILAQLVTAVVYGVWTCLVECEHGVGIGVVTNCTWDLCLFICVWCGVCVVCSCVCVVCSCVCVCVCVCSCVCVCGMHFMQCFV